MRTYKIKKGNRLLEQNSVNPEIVYNNGSITIDNCIERLTTNFTIQNTTNGVKVAEVNNSSVYLPEIDPEINVESAVYFNTLEHLISNGAEILNSGDIVKTKGFYTPKDGGGSTYLIRSSLNKRVNGYAQENIKKNEYNSRYIYDSPLIDNISLIQLSDTLYAELVIEEGSFVNLRQVGGRPLEDGVKIDNVAAMKIALTFIQRKKYFRSIYIPSGHWCFSAYILYHNIRTSVGFVGIKVFGDEASTICMPFNDSQYYIFRIGMYDSKDIPGSESRGAELYNLTFQCGNYDLSAKLKTLYGQTKYVTTAAIYILNATYSSFRNLTFKYVFNTCIRAVSDYETHFELLRFHCCGGVRNDKVYPVIQLDASSYSYASSVSANWFTFMHFDSCIGPYIYGGNQNNGHNEFNCILVTGNSETYNAACPDVISEKIQDTIVKWGVIDNYQGMTNFWPNMYTTIMCCTFDNQVIRDGVQYKMNSILHHEVSNHCHVYLGNVVMPLSKDGSGPWVTYTNADALSYSVKQLFSEEDWPFYCDSKYLPRNTVHIKDPRLIYANLNGNNLMAKYARSATSESPLHLTVVGNATTDQTIFVAKAGKQYGLKVYKESASGDYWINYQRNAYKAGLWVYKNGWIFVGDVKAKTLLGSDGNWRYVLIDNFFCFNEDTLVRISGGGYEFFYEQRSYPKGLIDLQLVSNNITNASNTTAVYNIIADPSIQGVTVSNLNSTNFSVSRTENVVTLTTKLENTTSRSIYTYLTINGKDSNGNIITKSAFLSVPQPTSGSSSETYQQDFVAEDGILIGSIDANLQQGNAYRITVDGDSYLCKVLATTDNDSGILLTGQSSYFIPSITTNKLYVASDSLTNLSITINKTTNSRIAMPILSSVTTNYTVLSVSGTYYLLDTTGTIYSSTDLINWQSYGSLSNDLLTRLRKSANQNSEDTVVVASDIEVPYEIKSVNLRKVGNQYNLYTSSQDANGNSWIGVSVSNFPTGPFTFSKVIVENSVYPSVRVINDEVYMLHGEGKLRIDKLNTSGTDIATSGRVFLNNIQGERCGVISNQNNAYYIFTSTPNACYVYKVDNLANLLNGSETVTACPNNPILVGSGTNVGMQNPTLPNNIMSGKIFYLTSKGLNIYPLEWEEMDDIGYWPIFKNTAGVTNQIMQSITI